MCSTYSDWWNSLSYSVKYRPASRRRLHRLRPARRDSACALSCSEFSGDPAFPLGGPVSALQRLPRSVPCQRWIFTASMAAALMAPVEPRLVVAVTAMVADLMPWLLGAVHRHGLLFTWHGEHV